MTNLISELTNYKNMLPAASKPYFMAGATASNSKLLFESTSLDWVTKDTKVTEIINYIHNIKDREKASDYGLQNWVIRKYAICVTIVTLTKTLFKNAFIWGVPKEAQDVVILFYLGVIFKVKNQTTK